MKKIKFLIATLVALLIISGFASAGERPNIVLIISDDQAWTDYGFMGHPEIQTPNLDALAERSLVMERGNVAAPLCRPSLASMVTGLYPFQHGLRVTTWTARATARHWTCRCGLRFTGIRHLSRRSWTAGTSPIRREKVAQAGKGGTGRKRCQERMALPVGE